MKDTGERHILGESFTNEAEYYNHLMHLATYENTLKFVQGKKVLDYGCGSGYGTYMLSETADKITGVDISSEAIDYAQKNYTKENLNFLTLSELSDEKFDVITSFQVIEHVYNDKEYVQKLKTLLNTNGVLIISTPDKTDRLFPYIQKPWNIFHIKEYDSGGLNKLLKKYFQDVEILKIGSDGGFVLKEISRTKKQKLITLPCTLFFYPNFLRIYLLKLQSKIYELLNVVRIKYKAKPPENKNDKEYDFISKYSVSDIKFGKNLDQSTDLFAICKTPTKRNL